MLVSINPKLSRITDEPFPAVTICNLNQAYKAKAEQFSVYSLEHTILQMICKLDVNVTIAEAITVTDWNNLKNFIFGISQPCFNMLLQCKYGSTFFNCSEIFRPIITNNGLCCTFNMVHPKIMYREMVIKVPSAQNYRYPIGYETIDWSTENGFPADLPKKFIPMKALGIGEGQGLSLILDVERDEYYCSSSNGIGFKILLHNPLEAPNMREIGLLLAPGRETKINIHADKVESEQYVRSVSKASRKCLFEDEQILKIYKKYTQRNCIEECSVFTWLGICGCLPYFKPMPYGNETICDMLDFTCVERVRLRTMLYDKAGKSCANTCIPGCNDINYLPSLTSAPLIQTGFPTQSEVAKNISNGYLKKNLAVVKIYFKESTYGGAKNSDFIRAPDFLSYKQNINAFLEDSAIHGLRYFNQQHLNLGERYSKEYAMLQILCNQKANSTVTEKVPAVFKIASTFGSTKNPINR
ncbi:pickpocket protein 28-like [Anastrepha ludens]|uniref:pickpocket protein 28-like n=1 Tax=Anastrepha ludens TaxID=28586 RepID=UPI0023B1BB0E|nr:pickpocket protein 28-like [Anastrepha ludens]